jgi:oligoendopeptidase F
VHVHPLHETRAVFASPRQDACPIDQRWPLGGDITSDVGYGGTSGRIECGSQNTHNSISVQRHITQSTDIHIVGCSATLCQEATGALCGLSAMREQSSGRDVKEPYPRFKGKVERIDTMIQSTPPSWDLTDLYSDANDPRIENAIAEVGAASQSFAEEYRGRVDTLDAGDLDRAIAAYEAILAASAKPSAFASLAFSAESTPERGAFMQHIRESMTAATLPLIFFDVELTGIGADRLAEISKTAELAPHRHYLETVALSARHRLTEDEERILEEQSNTGRRAFVRLYQEITSALRFVVPGDEKPVTLSAALDLQYSPDRAVRKGAAEAITAGLQSHARTISFIFNTLVQDKATEDRLRKHGYPEEARHISNELTPETVEAVVRTAVGGFGLVSRFYETKRKLLGLPTLAHYDRYAPLPVKDVETEIPFETARERVLAAFTSFDRDTYASSAERFFAGSWIDAPARPGKRSGAFCAYVTPDIHPYILVNYAGTANDVRTLAHELGHGVHNILSGKQSYLNFHGTLPMAEVASTFAEMLVFQEQSRTASPEAQLSAYARQIEQGIATIFRQACLYRFEQAVHTERREKGELSVERIGELWQENVGAMFGDAVTLESGHALWWSYVSHFFATPFYVYAYSFGEMLALALFRRYQQDGDAFTPRYLDMLRAGGSLSPHQLVAPLGIDLDDPAFWKGALDVFEDEVATFEKLAAVLVK